VADFQNWLTKLACENRLKHFVRPIASQMLKKIQRAESHAIFGCFALSIIQSANAWPRSVVH
jgi:hypothetical protein